METAISSAKEPVLRGGYQYHVRLKEGDLPRVVLLPGDPERVEKIASHMDDVEILTRHRGFVSARGKYKGVVLGAVCSGIGSPSTAIAMEELSRIGVRVFIRVGSTGAIRPDIDVGDLIIPTGAVRLEGTSRQYVIPEYPAVADMDVLLELRKVADRLGHRYHIGIVASTDSFYTGQGRPGFRGYGQSWMDHILSDLARANVLSFEMESSAIFIISSLYGLKAGSVLAVFANRPRDEFAIKGEEEAIMVGLEAGRELASKVE